MPHWHDIRHNAYTENPGSDWIALDGVLTPIGRASTEEALRRASPDAAHYLQHSALLLVEDVVTKALTGLAATADPVPAIGVVMDPDWVDYDSHPEFNPALDPDRADPIEPVKPADWVPVDIHELEAALDEAEEQERLNRNIEELDIGTLTSNPAPVSTPRNRSRKAK